MRAGVLWMLMMMCLSDGKGQQCSNKTYLKVSKLSKVNVSCPSTTSEEMSYQFFFNNSPIDLIHLTRRDSVKVPFSGQFEVTANSTGEFICRSEENYPPPHIHDCHTTEVIVAELPSLPEINGSVLAVNQSSPCSSPLIPEEVMWMGSGVLLVYSLSITCIAILLWKNTRRNEEDTNDYINTRPGEFRKPG
ncbi:hypothetical protein PBY51_022179 [Eleginops maclovinus]|uniref:Uncharacterized protein n=1 Tax=Eleginops maclovinus TaxID=56733 RepID=A0AAN7XCI4_ELEMC|nr:hypothetical protein PBY51_022179 [Eleginops maclovinus]